MKQETTYAVRIHADHRVTEPKLATLMYSHHGPEGPWHDMVTGDSETIWELFEIIEAKEELDRLRTLCDANNIEWRIGDDE